MIGFLGLLASLILLIVLTMRGMNLLIAAPLSAFLLAIVGGIPLFPQLAEADEDSFVGTYMEGFAGFVASWFLMFLLGAIFGKVMEDSKSAASVAAWLTRKLGAKFALVSVIGACAVLTYGGVSLFIVGFTVFPLALSLFKLAGYPRRFIPAALAFGSVTFTMTSAGSPEIQNWIPMEYLGTTPYAGWQVSLIVAILMAICGYFLLYFLIKRAVARGESFESRAGDPKEYSGPLPNPALSIFPLLTVLILSFIFHDSLGTSALVIALTGGIAVTWILNHRYMSSFWMAASEGTTSALLAIANTAAVVGFGAIARATPAFHDAVDVMTSVPGDPLVGGAVAVVVIVALTGSASGGLTIALPILGPQYIDAGVNPEALHRVSTLSSGALDSLPHGGYTVTTIRVICGETHKTAYMPIFWVTVLVPTIGVALAVALFSIGL